MFETVYWGADKSTEEMITACMVVALHGDAVVLSKPKRGWGILGGHREGDETPEECVRREAIEEAAVILDDPVLIGRWRTKKQFSSPHNEKYPPIGYQLLYTANVTEIREFTPLFEVTERAFIPISDIKNYHHDFVTFEPVFHYAISQMRVGQGQHEVR
jgi:8-oxo-dGTP diphosphatase